MKKGLFALLSLILVVALAACGNKNAEEKPAAGSEGKEVKPVTLTVGATAVPHAEILKHIQPALEKEGVKLEIKEFSDYVQPNVQTFQKQLDANFFQHQPYLDDENSTRKMDLVSVVAVHVEPLGAYSKKHKSIDEIPDGAIVGIPNDKTNGGRALSLLEKNGLIKLKEANMIKATVKDIVENPKNIKIKESDAAMLPRQLAEFDLAVINTNYALDAGIDPLKEALFMEDKDNPYANILVARPDNKDSDAMKKLVAALTSDDVKKFIEDQYKGAIIPAF
ncbi:MetQ/NlpA family ABC transporter substrate-binding protein [Paenibacillus sp.]|jgi:D-methionine transport system substrate-binding protein|uniref:MetQ/NlpA family ABC transporter substrate-binding protein n=1 Tax=Paenibacillus sp. TaxID=58172 RepID=UPI00281D656B|nr:MetQ/NlpA family ABC transporter substrate-binding protein [Paenibacillus sp.]MDR0268265.1 MetQ/NlpA family ABC transporter substrate-binding protein [Paenibacillus sp.]